MNYLTVKAEAGGFYFSPLYSRAALRSATFRYIPFIVSLQPRLPSQECFLHSIALRPTRSFIPLPFGFSTPHFGTQSQNRKLHFTQPYSLNCIQTPHMLCHRNQRYVCSPPGNQKPHRPLIVQVKKDHSRMALCLQPVRFTHSTVRCTARTSRHRSLIRFVNRTSFSTHV